MVHTDHASLYFSRPHLPPRSIVLSSTPRPAADSSTHSGVSPRLAAYRVSLLLNGRGEEGTWASCSPRSKVLGRSSATMLCRCQVFSRVTLCFTSKKIRAWTWRRRQSMTATRGGMLISPTSRRWRLREDISDIRGGREKNILTNCNRRW